MGLRDYVAALVAAKDDQLQAFVAVTGAECANAFAVILLAGETHSIAARFATRPGTVRQWIGKMTKAHLRADTVREGNSGPWFAFTSLRIV